MKKSINILIIDDSEIDRMILVSHIRYAFANTNLYETKNGEEALNFLNKAQMKFPNLIIVDINMPIMDGFGFLERYEALYWRKNPQSLVYFISSSVASQDLAMAKKFKSVTGYLTKPFDLVKAKNLLMSLFDLHRYDKGNP
mgnify:CR=1 FL=1